MRIKEEESGKPYDGKLSRTVWERGIRIQIGYSTLVHYLLPFILVGLVVLHLIALFF